MNPNEKLITDPTEAINAGRRWAYVIPDNAYRDEKGIVPSLVVEGVPGHFPMLGNGAHSSPWYWGTTEAEARKVADATNARRGISPEDAKAIEASAIGASMRNWNPPRRSGK